MAVFWKRGRGIGLLLALWAQASVAAPQASLSFAFEPRLGSYAALDGALKGHGYAPVGTAFLPAWGLRGRLFFDSGLFAQGAMGYGLRVAPGDPAPTTTTLTELSLGVGRRLESGLFASFDLGFSGLTQTVSSETDGGALVYLGPSIHPRLGWAWLASEPLGWFLALVAGFHMHLPLEAAHANPLWEEPFQRSVVWAFSLGLESGLGRGESR